MGELRGSGPDPQGDVPGSKAYTVEARGHKADECYTFPGLLREGRREGM